MPQNEKITVRSVPSPSYLELFVYKAIKLLAYQSKQTKFRRTDHLENIITR